MNSRIAMKTLNELNYSDTDYLSSPNALIGSSDVEENHWIPD
jgi:hypothetical protein